jgi:enoyl-CoA hydratase/carnithine racemase
LTDLLHEVADGIATVTFNRPDARNAMTFEMYEQLRQICVDAGSDPSLRVIVLTGAGGKAFASGTDIAQFKSFTTPQHGLDYEARISGVLHAIENCAVPTIAAIPGACTGGGAGIASCCDLRIAASNLRFGFPIARTLGNTLSLENYARLSSLLGPARVKDIIFTARLIEADEAKSIGLVSEIVEPDMLKQRSLELATLIASHAPLSLRAAKKALGLLRPAISAKDAEEINVLCYASEDFREGVDAFLSKRKPEWKGV